MSTGFVFRLRPLPALAALDEVSRERLGPHLRAGRTLSDVELFDVLDERGVHRYDLCLYRGEDGTVFERDALAIVAAFSQSSACESDDDDLLTALDAAFGEMVRRRAR